jgi:hypothetical protein
MGLLRVSLFTTLSGNTLPPKAEVGQAVLSRRYVPPEAKSRSAKSKCFEDGLTHIHGHLWSSDRPGAQLTEGDLVQ